MYYARQPDLPSKHTLSTAPRTHHVTTKHYTLSGTQNPEPPGPTEAASSDASAAMQETLKQLKPLSTLGSHLAQNILIVKIFLPVPKMHQTCPKKQS